MFSIPSGPLEKLLYSAYEPSWCQAHLCFAQEPWLPCHSEVSQLMRSSRQAVESSSLAQLWVHLQ